MKSFLFFVCLLCFLFFFFVCFFFVLFDLHQTHIICSYMFYFLSRKSSELEISNLCKRRYCVLIFNFHFVVVYLICFYIWLRVLTSRKVAIHSNGDNINIFIIIGFLGFWFSVGFVGITLAVLVLRCLRWYFVGSVGNSLVALVFLWLRWYFVGCYPLGKYWWKIKVVEKNEDVVRFCIKVLMAAWSKGVYTGMLRGLVVRKEGRKLLEYII